MNVPNGFIMVNDVAVVAERIEFVDSLWPLSETWLEMISKMCEESGSNKT